MEDTEYLLNLGKLCANLHSLEFTLRGFLLKYNEGREPSFDIGTIAAGSQVPENSFTNYDALGRLIDKFNAAIKNSCPSCCVDRTVVEVRDMIAHGRIAGRSPEPPYQLVKFGEPKSGMVPVQHVVTMDLQWLSSRISLVFEQGRKVAKASNQLGQNIFPETGWLQP